MGRATGIVERREHQSSRESNKQVGLRRILPFARTIGLGVGFRSYQFLRLTRPTTRSSYRIRLGIDVPVLTEQGSNLTDIDLEECESNGSPKCSEEHDGQEQYAVDSLHVWTEE